MAQQPEIVPQGSIAEKRAGRPLNQTREEKRRRFNLELILVALIFLFVAAVFGVLILGSLYSIDTTNRNLPVIQSTPKA